MAAAAELSPVPGAWRDFGERGDVHAHGKHQHLDFFVIILRAREGCL